MAWNKPMPANPVIAVAGATGAVGREMLKCLEQLNFPASEVRVLASARSAGQKLPFAGCGQVPAGELTVEEMTEDSFKGVDIALFSAGASISKKFRQAVTDAGAVMIDNSSAFRVEPDVPLVVPEVNPEAIAEHNGVIANPNCTTIMMVVVLQPIEKLSHIRRVHVSSYQSASGAGAAAMAELEQQYREVLTEGKVKTINKFPHQLAYNVIPQIDVMTDTDYTKEEMKMYHETRKIMHSDVRTSATCVRVSSLRSHSESVWIETERPLTVDEVRSAIAAAPGCTLEDDPQHYVYPMPLESAGKDDVFVGRVRRDLADDHGITLWLTGDQIRKGAALNAVQIAEYLVKVGNVK